MHHELKILRCYFDPGAAGEKPFEIRRNNDRGFQRGDTVEFREVNHLGLYTCRSFTGEITYVTAFEQKEDYVVFGYKLTHPSAVCNTAPNTVQSNE